MVIEKTCKNCKYNYTTNTDLSCCLKNLDLVKQTGIIQILNEENSCNKFKFKTKIILKILNIRINRILKNILKLLRNIYIYSICIFKELFNSSKKLIIKIKNKIVKINWYEISPIILLLVSILLVIFVYFYVNPIIKLNDNDDIEEINLPVKQLNLETVVLSETEYLDLMTKSSKVLLNNNAHFLKSSIRKNHINFEIFFYYDNYTQEDLVNIYKQLNLIWLNHELLVNIQIIKCDNPELVIANYPE